MTAEQVYAQFLLQNLDLTAERGLGNVQPLGRRAEAPQLGHVHEGTQLTQLHRYSLAAYVSLKHDNMGISPLG
jgi:hypothetical protein